MLEKGLIEVKNKIIVDSTHTNAVFHHISPREELIKQAMARIANTKQQEIQISQAEYYSLVNILKLFPELKEFETPNKNPQGKKELSPDFIRQIEREILGME